ncbi:putative peptidase C14 [Colletotrichum sublineola]|uniref:Putative peptidase C14 n=1 Tax=Colletotrichum sublineola TaxID=1173701 RepID=A0A066WWR2_COLSU|nr:putative peptidase C14 [Colletotrichum sublineola]
MAAASAGLFLFLVGAATAVFFCFKKPAYPPLPLPTTTATTLAMETQGKRRGVLLRQVNSLADNVVKPEEGIDINAVHGLDTRSPET